MNNTIDVSRIRVSHKLIPQGFSGHKIVFLSDVHQREFGVDNSMLLKLIEIENPNYIFVTGDILDDSLEQPLVVGRK